MLIKRIKNEKQWNRKLFKKRYRAFKAKYRATEKNSKCTEKRKIKIGDGIIFKHWFFKMSMDLRGFFRKEMAPVDDNAVPVGVVVLCRPNIQSLANKNSFLYLIKGNIQWEEWAGSGMYLSVHMALARKVTRKYWNKTGDFANNLKRS